MKIKTFILSFVIVTFSLLAAFTLSGCWDASIGSLKENYESLSTLYKNNSVVFKGETTYQGIETTFMISYGSVVDGYVSENRSGYGELESIYNAIYIVSNDYIEKNIGYVLAFGDEQLSDEAKKNVEAANSSLHEYVDSFSNFVTKRNSLVRYFDQFDGKMSEKADEAFLRDFKRAYGKMVSKNVELAENIAACIESTTIFELLKETTPTETDVEIVKEYIRAKVLPIYSEFLMTEIWNNMNWDAQTETETKNRINNLISDLKASFSDNYVDWLVGKPRSLSTLSQDDMKGLINLTENFLVEVEDYLIALRGLEITKLAVEFDNNLQEYLKNNQFAEVYLQKLEQFVGITLENYLTCVTNIIYN